MLFFLFLFKFCFVLLYVYDYFACMYTGAPVMLKEGIESPEARVAESCELP